MRPRGRPRDEAARERILATAVRLALEQGIRKITIESIAREAGVSKQTVYNHWKHKTWIVLEGLVSVVHSSVPKRGETIEETVAIIMQIFVRYQGSEYGRLARQIVCEAQYDPALHQAFLKTVSHSIREEINRLLHPYSIDPFLYDLVFGATWYRTLVTQEGLDEEYGKKLADFLLDMQRRTPVGAV